MNSNNHRASVCARLVLPLWSLLTLACMTLYLPTRSVAQEPSEKPNTKKETLKEGPPPPNPLVLGDPQEGTTHNLNPAPAGTPRRTKDYTHNPEEQRAGKRHKPLPLFGYNFFAPAREFLTARRDYLRRSYEADLNGGGRSAQRNTSTRPGSRTKAGGKDGSNTKTQKRGTGGNEETIPRTLPRAGDESDETGDETGDSSRKSKGNTGDGTDEDQTGQQPGDRMSDDGSDTGTNTDGTPAPSKRRARKTGAELDAAEIAIGAGNAGEDTASPPSRVRRKPLPTPDDTGDENYYPDYPPRSRSPRRSTSDPYYSDPYYDEAGANTRDREFKPPTPVGPNEVAGPFDQILRNVAATPPQNYQLAPGDTLTIRYWSPTRAPKEIGKTVEADGSFVFEEIGRISARGLTAQQVENALRERLRRYLKNADVSLALKELRTIQVTIGGEAFLPGTYNVPAVATAFNVLYAAGGPNEDGSLRAIEVRRHGRLVGTIDIYQFLIGGGKMEDIPLQPGDLISIPSRLSQIEIFGEVRKPAVFELTEKETLVDALRYAGGVKPSGVDQRVQVNTLNPGVSRVLKDVDLKRGSEAANLALYDGDVVDVFSVRNTLANRVTIEGAVDQPSEYAWADGMRVADLVEKARGPLSDTYLTHADLFRWNPDNTTTLIPIDLEKALARDPNANVPLSRWDRLKVYTRKEMAWTGRRTVMVRGAAQKPGFYDYSENMRVRDLLRMAGGPLPDAYRAVLLHRRGDGSFSYDFIRLADGAPDEKGLDTPMLDNDVLAIYRVGEAQFTPEHLVSIRGAVVGAGVYPRGDGMRLSELVKLAGGFRPGGGTRVVIAHARRAVDAPDATLATREVRFDARGMCAPQDDLRLEDGDVVTVQGDGGFQQEVQVVTIGGAVNRPGPIILKGKKVRLSDAIKEAGGLRPEAFPDGAEFVRNPALLATAGQKGLVQIIGQLNDLLNQSEAKREQIKTKLELLKATNSAAQSGNILGSAQQQPNPASAAVVNGLNESSLVSPPRVFKPEELQPSGNIAINLQEAMRHPGGNDDILLVDGDTVNVPETPTTVQVVGAVYHGRGVLYKPGATLQYYVDHAGGFAPDAATDRIKIVHLGSGLIPANKAKQIKPGDILLVPDKPLAAKISSGNGFSLDRIFSSITNSAILFKVATSIFGL